MGENRSNHTVYNVNYHYVWCPKSSKAKLCVPRGIFDLAQYRHAILEPIEDSLEASFRDVCDGTATRYCRSTSRPTTCICSSPTIRRTPRARLSGQLRALRRGRCGNTTSRTWRVTYAAVDSGNGRTTSGLREQSQRRRLNGISNEQNTSECRLHPRGQAPRHSPCLSVDQRQPHRGERERRQRWQPGYPSAGWRG